MLDNNDFKSANKYVAQLYSSRKNDSDYNEWGVITEKYLPAATLTLKAEASYLMDQNDPEAEKLFMLCLNDVSGNIGKHQVTLGVIASNSYNDMDRNINEITPYNACLLPIIQEALIKDNPNFAKKVFKMMKKNYRRDGTEYSHKYDYQEDNTQIEEAERLLSEYDNN